MIHDPDVALTDFALTLENGVLAGLLARRRDRLGAMLFVSLALSSLIGGTYHGFFPQGIATPAGHALWLATMLTLGVSGALLWMLDGRVAHWPPAPARTVAVALLAIYAIWVLAVDSSFRIASIFTGPPLMLLLVLFARARDFRGAGAIALMFVAAVLQQTKIGLHPRWFDHNALYHLLQGIALAMLFVSLRHSTAVRASGMTST